MRQRPTGRSARLGMRCTPLLRPRLADLSSIHSGKVGTIALGLLKMHLQGKAYSAVHQVH